MKVTFRETKIEYSIDSKGKVTGPTNTEGTEEDEKTDGSYIEGKGVNSPQLLSGMTKIMFTDPTDTAKGETIKEGQEEFNDANWYDYTTQKWANVETEDGSMWVWIPRFAYKINSTNKTTDVKFLVGTTDQYYDESGRLQTAKRASANETADTTNNYYVHPAFTNESSIGYSNGGWDAELAGIWVAKFEAGYASSNNNSATVKASSQTYSQSTSYVAAVESTSGSDATLTARNWLDGIYGETTTNIKYPTFQGVAYTMNYINHNDAYNIAKVLTESGNIYGLSSSTTDSHLMKNSEWGAVAYLSQSQYGLKGSNIYINNVTLNSGSQKRTETAGKTGVDSVYAVTGVTTGTEDGTTTTATIGNINGTTGNTASSEGVYTWNQKTGQGASSTGTIYGIYDLSGGAWERTAAYVANGHDNLEKYGASIAYDSNGNLKTTSTKYTTVYPHDTETDKPTLSNTTTNFGAASKANYLLNTKIFGDAIRETSTAGTGSTSWYGDYSSFTGLYCPFSVRGGRWSDTSHAGLFAFYCTGGNSVYSNGFRAVLVAV